MTTKATLKWGALAVICTVAACGLLRSCRLYDKLSVLKGEHEALQVAYADLDGKSKVAIEALKKDILAQDVAIREASRDITVLRDKIRTKDSHILSLEEEFTQLGENQGAKIINLQAQVSAWREKFALAEDVIAKKDAIIFDLTAKYEYQVKISTEWEASYHRQVELHEVCLERITAMEKEWRGIQLGSKVKTYVIAAVGAGLVYSLVKK
jgi:hypothetical protein